MVGYCWFFLRDLANVCLELSGVFMKKIEGIFIPILTRVIRQSGATSSVGVFLSLLMLPLSAAAIDVETHAQPNGSRLKVGIAMSLPGAGPGSSGAPIQGLELNQEDAGRPLTLHAFFKGKRSGIDQKNGRWSVLNSFGEKRTFRGSKLVLRSYSLPLEVRYVARDPHGKVRGRSSVVPITTVNGESAAYVVSPTDEPGDPVSTLGVRAGLRSGPACRRGTGSCGRGSACLFTNENGKPTDAGHCVLMGAVLNLGDRCGKRINSLQGCRSGLACVITNSDGSGQCERTGAILPVGSECIGYHYQHCVIGAGCRLTSKRVDSKGRTVQFGQCIPIGPILPQNSRCEFGNIQRCQAGLTCVTDHSEKINGRIVWVGKCINRSATRKARFLKR